MRHDASAVDDEFFVFGLDEDASMDEAAIAGAWMDAVPSGIVF